MIQPSLNLSINRVQPSQEVANDASSVQITQLTNTDETLCTCCPRWCLSFSSTAQLTDAQNAAANKNEPEEIWEEIDLGSVQDHVEVEDVGCRARILSFCREYASVCLFWQKPATTEASQTTPANNANESFV